MPDKWYDMPDQVRDGLQCHKLTGDFLELFFYLFSTLALGNVSDEQT